jgi:hypothetical protein
MSVAARRGVCGREDAEELPFLRSHGHARFVPFARSSEDAQQHHVQGKAEDEFLQLVYQAGSPRGSDEDCSFAEAKIFWVAVTVDAKAKLFSAYMGDVAKLPSPKCIPMHPTRDVSNYKCLARDQHDDEISETWSNVVGTVSA